MAFIALCKCVCALKLFALPPHPWVSLLYVYRFDPLPACGYLSHAIIRCLLIAYEHPNPNLLQGVCLPASIHSISTANIRDHIRCTEIHHCQISMFHCVILLNARLRISGSHLRGFFSDDWWCAWNLFLRFYFNLFSTIICVFASVACCWFVRIIINQSSSDTLMGVRDISINTDGSNSP